MKLLKNNKQISNKNKIRKKFKTKTKRFFRKKNVNKKINLIQKMILSIILILFNNYHYFIYLLEKKQVENLILIQVDISKAKKEGGGPRQLQRGLSKILPYKTKHCKFIPVDGINFLNLTKNIDYYFSTSPNINEKIYNKLKQNNKVHSLLLGPLLVPIKWFRFPNIYHWEERRFRDILSSVKGVVVHSIRVRDHLAKRSNTIDLLNKFIIFRACSYNMPKKIKPFRKRKIDILLYLKYADINRRKQGKILFELLKSTNKSIEILKSGHYKRDYLINLANNSKFVIFFSFYDTGAIALKEIQNYGVITFSLQKDLVVSDETGYYIPELDDNNIEKAFDKIMEIINDKMKKIPNSRKIAKINQGINKCQKALDDICNGILYN